MHILDPRGMLALLDCFKGSTVVFEHETKRLLGSWEYDMEHYKDLGYNVVHEVKDEALFLQNGDDRGDRIVVIPRKSTPSHVWIAKERQDFHNVCEQLNSHQGFRKLTEGSVTNHEVASRMFLHLQTADVIQIVWRSKLIFKRLFKKPKK